MSPTATITDPTRFIRANTRLLPVPHAPEIVLHLADEATELWQKTEEELGEIGLPPPFWAFAWAGGQALARYVLDRPEIVRGRRVLDFAAGSGLVGIAAAKAGAARVEAADIDAFACAAMPLNAQANGVVLVARRQDLVGTDEGWDVVLAGDICYERDLAASVVAWLRDLSARGATVLVGDPGRAYLPKADLVALATYEVPVTRALEDAEIKRSTVWRLA
ncbi:class I SAM-dependent methyltransferase [Salinarimonas ramus]|uniref:50S ribosomal protein L11 methyltransferase n=1 Tax=Salinarimonas ramus TaxID=690164 RepID=A0A917V584_9HYPH|nr:methyltransferase [Salinarimonas ramus]GGK39492.1 50S ribosomal protein L11 methyltransferase [Salinarimonas ramus]